MVSGYVHLLINVIASWLFIPVFGLRVFQNFRKIMLLGSVIRMRMHVVAKSALHNPFFSCIR